MWLVALGMITAVKRFCLVNMICDFWYAHRSHKVLLEEIWLVALGMITAVKRFCLVNMICYFRYVCRSHKVLCQLSLSPSVISTGCNCAK